MPIPRLTHLATNALQSLAALPADAKALNTALRLLANDAGVPGPCSARAARNGVAAGAALFGHGAFGLARVTALSGLDRLIALWAWRTSPTLWLWMRPL